MGNIGTAPSVAPTKMSRVGSQAPRTTVVVEEGVSGQPMVTTTTVDEEMFNVPSAPGTQAPKTTVVVEEGFSGQPPKVTTTVDEEILRVPSGNAPTVMAHDSVSQVGGPPVASRPPTVFVPQRQSPTVMSEAPGLTAANVPTRTNAGGMPTGPSINPPTTVAPPQVVMTPPTTVANPPAATAIPSHTPAHTVANVPTSPQPTMLATPATVMGDPSGSQRPGTTVSTTPMGLPVRPVPTVVPSVQPAANVKPASSAIRRESPVTVPNVPVQPSPAPVVQPGNHASAPPPTHFGNVAPESIDPASEDGHGVTLIRPQTVAPSRPGTVIGDPAHPHSVHPSRPASAGHPHSQVAPSVRPSQPGTVVGADPTGHMANVPVTASPAPPTAPSVASSTGKRKPPPPQPVFQDEEYMAPVVPDAPTQTANVSTKTDSETKKPGLLRKKAPSISRKDKVTTEGVPAGGVVPDDERRVHFTPSPMGDAPTAIGNIPNEPVEQAAPPAVATKPPSVSSNVGSRPPSVVPHQTAPASVGDAPVAASNVPTGNVPIVRDRPVSRPTSVVPSAPPAVSHETPAPIPQSGARPVSHAPSVHDPMPTVSHDPSVHTGQSLPHPGGTVHEHHNVPDVTEQAKKPNVLKKRPPTPKGVHELPSQDFATVPSGVAQEHGVGSVVPDPAHGGTKVTTPPSIRNGLPATSATPGMPAPSAASGMPAASAAPNIPATSAAPGMPATSGTSLPPGKVATPGSVPPVTSTSNVPTGTGAPANLSPEAALAEKERIATQAKAKAEAAEKERLEKERLQKERDEALKLAADRHREHSDALADLKKTMETRGLDDSKWKTAYADDAKAKEKRRADRGDRDKKWQDAFDKLLQEKEDDKKWREAEGKKPGSQAVIDYMKKHSEDLTTFLKALAADIVAQNVNQHQQTQAAAKNWAREQVAFNLSGYLDDFSKALSSEVRALLKEVGDLRETRRALYYELAELLLLKGRQSHGDLMAVLPFPSGGGVGAGPGISLPKPAPAKPAPPAPKVSSCVESGRHESFKTHVSSFDSLLHHHPRPLQPGNPTTCLLI